MSVCVYILYKYIHVYIDTAFFILSALLNQSDWSVRWMLVLVHQFRVQVSSMRQRVVRASTSLFLKSKQYSLRKVRWMAGCSPGMEMRLLETWSCGRLAVGVRSSLILLQRNCSRLWCLPSYSSTCESLRQAVAFQEHAEPSCGPGGTSSSGFGSSAAAGVAEAWSQAQCVSSCTFYTGDMGFFGNCLTSPGTDKSSVLSCLAHSGFWDTGTHWRGEWPPTVKPINPRVIPFSDLLLGTQTHSQKRKVLKLFYILAGCKGKRPCWETEGFPNPYLQFHKKGWRASLHTHLASQCPER